MGELKIEAVPGSKYVAKQPDANGHIHYSQAEHKVWHDLMNRQLSAIQPVACSAYLRGLDLLDLPPDHIPQLDEVSVRLRAISGWEVAAVPALIPFTTFCHLLADKKFPCATFIRRREELDYLQEPDIFHEIFGHCAMLTDPYFAEFTKIYGELGLKANDTERRYLERLYWFTVEFGLVTDTQANSGFKIYGGGILSSIGETGYAMSDVPAIKPFDIVDVLRTPYRIDIMQPIYFLLESLHQLFEIARTDIFSAIHEAHQLGMHEPEFEPLKQVAGNTSGL